jgi:hypothetical protein
MDQKNIFEYINNIKLRLIDKSVKSYIPSIIEENIVIDENNIKKKINLRNKLLNMNDNKIKYIININELNKNISINNNILEIIYSLKKEEEIYYINIYEIDSNYINMFDTISKYENNDIYTLDFSKINVIYNSFISKKYIFNIKQKKAPDIKLINNELILYKNTGLLNILTYIKYYDKSKIKISII